MTYKIYKTDGSLLAEIVDSNIDQTATDLTLIGKNVTGYGEYINDNFVRLLENFSSTSEPNNPVVGQLWFDTSENRLKVYDGAGFRIGSGPIVQGTPPLNPIQGDYWIDNSENVLYFYTGDGNRYSASKIWKDSQGESGFNVTNLYDLNNNEKVVVKLFAGGTLLGIFSKHEEFTPSTLIEGFTGTIKPGFNVGNIDGFKFHARATTADALVDTLGNVKTTSSFVFTDTNNSMYGRLSIINSEPLRLGVGQESSLFVSGSDFTIRSNYNGQDFKIVTREANTYNDALTIKAATSRVGIFNNDPQAMLDIAGDLIVAGDLTVNGTMTTVNSTTLSIEDKNIELGKVDTPTDVLADAGGIILKGTTDKKIVYHYDNDLTMIDRNRYWDSTESFNIASGKSYKINGVTVLSAGTLAASIHSAPGLTEIGNLNQALIGNLIIGDPNPSGTYSNTIRSSNGPIVLQAYNHLPVDVKNSRIINLQDPLTTEDGRYNAVNRNYLDGRTFSDWTTIDARHFALKNERLFVDTITGPVDVILPENPANGDSIRFFDINGTWDTDPLTIKRYRTVDYASLGGTSSSSATSGNPYASCTTSSVTGIGTGITVTITITEDNQTYGISNTNIEISHVGDNYVDGEQLLVTGDQLGGTSPANDLVFSLSLGKILGIDSDLLCNTPDSSFGLVYTNYVQGWKYLENVALPSTVTADVIGNLLSSTDFSTIVDTSVSPAEVTGNLTGDVVGNITGTVLTANQPNITDLGTLNDLTVSGTITGDLLGNVTGDLTGNVNGDVTGNLTGDVTAQVVTSDTELLVSSDAGMVKIRSGFHGLLISAYDDTTTQDQYAISITPGGAAGLTSTTNLYGDVRVVNSTTSNITGGSFRLPWYTTAERNARFVSFINYGELIYNTTDNKVQAYTSSGWVDIS